MAAVKWIKLMTEMFDNAKIKYLRTLPEGNNIVLFWVMLLTKAGKCNSNGYVFLTENIPYTQEMLAAEFGFELNTVKLALESLKRLNMIQLKEEIIEICGWEQYQNIDGLERIREQTRKRVANYRNKQKLIDCNVTSNVTVTQGNAIEEEEEEERDIDIEEEREEEKKIDLNIFIQKWNSLGLNKIISIKNSRLKHLKARIEEYSIDEVIETIEKVNESSFLKGNNDRNWIADFDWLLNPNNFIKVMEDKYKDKAIKSVKTTIVKGNASNFNNFSGRNYSERYEYLQEQMLLGQATPEEIEEFNSMRGGD